MSIAPSTKRYYASDQQIATRIGDKVYYHLTDPTGTSLTVVDEAGTSSTLTFDAYGGVLTNTLPTKLQTALAGQGVLVDADIGLIHQGGGRYYDPALGRPLQPNPFGGVPTVPQSLNRYGATSMGAVGVAEGVQHIHPLLVTASKGTGKTAATLLFNQGRTSLINQLTRSRPTGFALVTARGAHARTPAALIGAISGTYFRPPVAEALIAKFSKFDIVSNPWPNSFRGPVVWRISESAVDDLNPISGLKILSIETEKRALLSAAWTPFLKHGSGLGWAVGLNTLVQYWGDTGNPYLTSSQRRWRLLSAGVGGGGGGYVAGIIAGTLFTTKVGAALGIPAGPAGIFVGSTATFTYGIIYFGLVQPVIFKNFGLNPERNLAPLQP